VATATIEATAGIEAIDAGKYAREAFRGLFSLLAHLAGFEELRYRRLHASRNVPHALLDDRAEAVSDQGTTPNAAKTKGRPER